MPNHEKGQYDRTQMANRVRSDVILAAVREHYDAHPDLFIEDLAERAGVRYESLETWMSNPSRSVSMRFDVADRLLCAINAVHLWWGPFEDIYYGVKLVDEVCANPDCDKPVRKMPSHGGGRRPKYCSNTCKSTVNSRRTRGGRSRSEQKLRCPWGHERTPENTTEYTHKSTGYVEIRCRKCESRRAADRRDKERQERHARALESRVMDAAA